MIASAIKLEIALDKELSHLNETILNGNVRDSELIFKEDFYASE